MMDLKEYYPWFAFTLDMTCFSVKLYIQYTIQAGTTETVKDIKSPFGSHFGSHIGFIVKPTYLKVLSDIELKHLKQS